MVYRKSTQEVQAHSHEENSVAPLRNSGSNGHIQRVNGASKHNSRKSAQRDVSSSNPESLRTAVEVSKNTARNRPSNNGNGLAQRVTMPISELGLSETYSEDGLTSESERTPMGHQEFEDLASKMYTYIKQKLEVERERHGRPGLSLWT